MITEIIFIDLPKGITRDEVMTKYRTTAPQWAANKDLIRKYYFFDPDKSLGGGVYIWKSREAASRWHGEEYHRMVQNLYGSPPRIQIIDALMHIDSVAGTIEEFGA